MIASCRGDKEALLEEMAKMRRDCEREMEDLTRDLKEKFKVYEDIIRNDVIAHQNDAYRMQKEITLLQRDKLNLENECAKVTEKLNKVESRLYGRNLFSLETNAQELDALSDMNLRSEARNTMTNFAVIH